MPSFSGRSKRSRTYSRNRLGRRPRERDARRRSQHRVRFGRDYRRCGCQLGHSRVNCSFRVVSDVARCPDLHHYRRQIIFSTTLITSFLHFSANHLSALAAPQQGLQFFVIDVPGDSIGAKKECCTFCNLDGFHVHFDRAFSAERAADDILAGVVRRLFRCHATGTYLLFDDRMVFCLAVEFAVRS